MGLHTWLRNVRGKEIYPMKYNGRMHDVLKKLVVPGHFNDIRHSHFTAWEIQRLLVLGLIKRQSNKLYARTLLGEQAVEVMNKFRPKKFYHTRRLKVYECPNCGVYFKPSYLTEIDSIWSPALKSVFHDTCRSWVSICIRKDCKRCPERLRCLLTDPSPKRYLLLCGKIKKSFFVNVEVRINEYWFNYSKHKTW